MVIPVYKVGKYTFLLFRDSLEHQTSNSYTRTYHPIDISQRYIYVLDLYNCSIHNVVVRDVALNGMRLYELRAFRLDLIKRP